VYQLAAYLRILSDIVWMGGMLFLVLVPVTREECIHTSLDGFEKIVSSMFEHHEGAIWPSERPGRGIKLIYDAVAEHAFDPEDLRACGTG